MNRIQLTYKSLFFISLMFLIFGCVKDIEGEFYLSKDTDKYRIDTTMTSMRLIEF